MLVQQLFDPPLQGLDSDRDLSPQAHISLRGTHDISFPDLLMQERNDTMIRLYINVKHTYHYREFVILNQNPLASILYL